MECCLAVLKEDPIVDTWKEYKKDLILKMSAHVLPRLNAGREDDEKLIPSPIYGGKSTKENG